MPGFIPFRNPAQGRGRVRIVRFKAETEAAWAMLGDDGATLHHVAGTFRAWSPRIAGGEGAHALPRTGRRYALADVELLAPVEHGAAVYDARGERLSGSVSVAGARPLHSARGVALIGAPLVGRQNALRSLFGYGLAWPAARGESPPIRLGPVVTARGVSDYDQRVPLALAQDLARLDASTPLRPGDVVLFDLAAEAPISGESSVLTARVA